MPTYEHFSKTLSYTLNYRCYFSVFYIAIQLYDALPLYDVISYRHVLYVLWSSRSVGVKFDVKARYSHVRIRFGYAINIISTYFDLPLTYN